MQNEVWDEDALLVSRCSLLQAFCATTPKTYPEAVRALCSQCVGSFPVIFSLETYVPAKALANRHCTDGNVSYPVRTVAEH